MRPLTPVNPDSLYGRWVDGHIFAKPTILQGRGRRHWYLLLPGDRTNVCRSYAEAIDKLNQHTRTHRTWTHLEVA